MSFQRRDSSTQMIFVIGSAVSRPTLRVRSNMLWTALRSGSGHLNHSGNNGVPSKPIMYKVVGLRMGESFTMLAVQVNGVWQR
jgi:hypothetical protein